MDASSARPRGDAITPEVMVTWTRLLADGGELLSGLPGLVAAGRRLHEGAQVLAGGGLVAADPRDLGEGPVGPRERGISGQCSPLRLHRLVEPPLGHPHVA